MTPGKFQMLSEKKREKTNDSETLEPTFFSSEQKQMIAEHERAHQRRSI